MLMAKDLLKVKLGLTVEKMVADGANWRISPSLLKPPMSQNLFLTHLYSSHRQPARGKQHLRIVLEINFSLQSATEAGI